MSDRVEDLGVVDARDARLNRPQEQPRDVSTRAGAFVLGLLLVALGLFAIGLSFRDLATAIGLALLAPGALLLVGASYAKRYGR